MADSLPRDATAVVYPDHPYLLQPPDILVGRRGQLTAVFLLSDDEHLGRGRHRLARYLLCRLALPAHTAFLVIANDLDAADDGGVGVADYAARPYERRLKLPAEPANSLWNDLVDGLRSLHLERFAENWDVAASPDAIFSGQRARPGRSTFAMNLGAQRQLTSRYLDVAQDHLVLGSIDYQTAAHQKASISTANLVATQLDYGLDTALDGLVRTANVLRSNDAHLATHVGYVPRHASGRGFDPDRPARAAAFAGFRVDPRPTWGFDDAI